MSEQIDTSTADGWEAVIKHALDGGAVQQCYSTRWGHCDEHPHKWDLRTYIYRIKISRVPQIDEAWKDNNGMRWAILDSEDGRLTVMSQNRVVSTHNPDWFVEFIGKIDLSLLEGEG